MRYALTLFTSIIIMASCQPVNHKQGNDADDKIAQLSWMLGQWKMQTPEGVIIEEWNQSSDSLLTGSSYMVTTGGDTPFHENIRLTFENDTLYYRPTVSNQNEGREVSFAEKHFKDHEVIFENLSHDFPQRIIYKKTSDSTIMATIEGNIQGQMKREEFAYVKLK